MIYFLTLSGIAMLAIIEHRKFQERKIMWPQPKSQVCCVSGNYKTVTVWHPPRRPGFWVGKDAAVSLCPYGQPGNMVGMIPSYFGAREEEAGLSSFNSPPKIRILDVVMNRLQDVSEQQAQLEGWSCRDEFAFEWNRQFHHKWFPWESNPWVWVLSFVRE